MKIIECPRDAMQGIGTFIPTEAKVRYINQLLKVGFDVIDFGSFVSSKAIPQMKDTSTVIRGLDLSGTVSKLLAIVANTRGATEAATFDQISYLGFPLSISETFQRRNTNKSIPEALNTLSDIKEVCVRTGKELVVYISMGFGNPYGDPYHINMISGFVDILQTLGADIISLADTIGISAPEGIEQLFLDLRKSFPKADLGIHLHSTPAMTAAKIEAAYNAGCTRLDGALRGYGGCPMADDELVGNIATEEIVSFLETHNIETRIKKDALSEALRIADEIFPYIGK